MSDFLALGISEPLVKTLQSNSIVEPTSIQKQAIPAILAGKDVIGQAKTGSGKTFAFVLPAIEKVDFSLNHVQVLIVTPTRELAIQITNEIRKFTIDENELEVLAVYGGQDVEKQLKKLQRNISIVVATPGRLMDHMRRGTIDLSHISLLVLLD